jgi:poly(3-hydroxybutyrate) depolymerase
LVVAPLSGHFSALLEDCLAALVPEHDVYFTDWTDARDVPVESGNFAVEENIGYLLDFMHHLGDRVHLLGLCQSAMPLLAAAALLAAHGDLAQPSTMTLINGMIDPRISPTRIARLARLRTVAWFESNVIRTVEAGYPGENRLVYPADVQHAGLMAYLARHLANGGELRGKVLDDDGQSAAEQPFLEAYLSVMDLPAAFFLDTIKMIFHDFALPQGRLFWRGEHIALSAIRKPALMTVEGELDDVSGPGQTQVAHDLCTGIPGDRRTHHVQPGVGHFGAFHGRSWRAEVMPRIGEFIRTMA